MWLYARYVVNNTVANIYFVLKSWRCDLIYPNNQQVSVKKYVIMTAQYLIHSLYSRNGVCEKVFSQHSSLFTIEHRTRFTDHSTSSSNSRVNFVRSVTMNIKWLRLFKS